MGLTTYAFLLFGISLAFYFAGSVPPMFAVLGCDTSAQTCASTDTIGTNLISSILTSIANNPSIALGGVVFLVSAVLLGGSFIVIYTIPILLIIAANLFLLPTSFLFSDALPFEIRLIVGGFLNLMLIMTMISFIRGGD